MIEYPYLLALALIEQNGHRAMPLGGKAIKVDAENDLPCPTAQDVSLELFARIFERTDEGSLKRAIKDDSFLIVKIPMQAMQLKLPSIKSNWINRGDKRQFLNELKKLSSSIWRLKFAKYHGISFIKL
mgnify:CR=1 FL=1|tara:strand:+ start:92 stop:475 length:384 start_codon:yes stop_codon:yes gene_type:complete